MTEISQNFFLNLGALGLMVMGLTWFSKKIFDSFMKQVEELKTENRNLEAEFRSYLISTAKEHHKVIEHNTEAYNSFVKMIEIYINSKK